MRLDTEKSPLEQIAQVLLAHGVAVKQHIQRPKDRESLRQLLAIRRIREEEGGGRAERSEDS